MGELTREVRFNVAFVKLAATLVAEYDVIDLLHTLMQECIEILDTQAGGLLLADRSGALELVASTSEHAHMVEVLQLAAGAGPCIECFRTGTVLNIADISETAHRWPTFCTAALEQGFHSVFTTPLQLRGQTIGTLNLFGTEVGALDATDADAVRALADVAAIGILHARLVDVAEQLQSALDSRILIEQAKGVLSELRGIDVEEAFDVLRRYARDHNLALHAVAEAVVGRSVEIVDVGTAPAD